MKIDSINQVGLYANRPAYGIAGRLYFATDQSKLYYDTGSAWTELNPAVAARYTTNAGQSLTNASNTRLNYEDKIYDTHDAVTVGASWVFTAPFSGYYHFCASAMIDSTNQWSTGEVAQLELHKHSDSSRISTLARITSESSGIERFIQITGSDDVYITNGEGVYVELYQESGSARIIYNNAGCEAHTYVAIHKV